MQSGQGVTQLITRVLFQTIDTILLNPGKIDELIVILDSEEYNEQERKKQVENIIKEYIDKKNCAVDFLYKVFVCNHCFETWLLGMVIYIRILDRKEIFSHITTSII